MAGWVGGALAVAVLSSTAFAGVASRLNPPGDSPGRRCVSAPVRLVRPADGRLLEPFRAPACPYCPGRRGVVLATEPGTPVVAAASGDVTFAGQVAGVLWVVVQASPRVRISHGRLAGLSRAGTDGIVAGQRVNAGDPIGTAGETLYVGATSGGEPVDPWPALSGRAHLVREGACR